MSTEAMIPELSELITEVRELKRQILMLRGKDPKSPTLKTAEAAEMLGLSPREFRRVHVDNGNISPIPRYKCKFHRYQVEALKAKIDRLNT